MVSFDGKRCSSYPVIFFAEWIYHYVMYVHVYTNYLNEVNMIDADDAYINTQT